MKKILFAVIALSFSLASFAQKTKAKTNTPPALKTELDSVSYAMGASLASFYKAQGLSNINISLATKAMEDVLNDTSLLNEPQINSCITNYLQKIKTEKMTKTKEAGQAFLQANKSKPGVIALPSGLQYQVLTEGTGPKPTATDKVKCHYHGTLVDGTVFDSSVERGEPATFPVNGVIQGWVEALQLMPVGSKWRLFIPSELAYGERQAGAKILPGSTLIFDVELLEIVK
ncbi:MAG TPA: FKBP-type peptidyl-prolyl cis-trans isomerase [Chitinophagaceae bacterium]|jgi:FKBP-type peptidyl-prolyl cis-trans isomerases 1